MSTYIIQLPDGQYSRHRYRPHKTKRIENAYFFPTKQGALSSNAWRWSYPIIDGRRQFESTEAKLLEVVHVETQEVAQ